MGKQNQNRLGSSKYSNALEQILGSYVNRLKDNYTVVKKTNLLDGIYKKHGHRCIFYIKDHFDEDTGFVVITKKGIKKTWSGEEVIIENGLPVNEDIYKIMSRKDLIREEKLNELLKDSQ